MTINELGPRLRVVRWDDEGEGREGMAFAIVGRSGYGPNRNGNPVYEAEGWKISRHQWELPERSWAWQAAKGGHPTLYGDTLPDLAYEIWKAGKV